MTESLLEPLVVNVEEAARLLALSRSQIYVLMDQRKLGFVKFGGARRIPIADLRDYIERHGTKAL